MSESIKGRIHQVESFGSVDGPGVRYIVFLKGCHMRCRYCHNPETWKEEGGTLETAQEVFDKAYRYRNYWKNGGGITVSGGEALLQMEFVTELLKLRKRMVCIQLLIRQVILLRWSRNIWKSLTG